MISTDPPARKPKPISLRPRSQTLATRSAKTKASIEALRGRLTLLIRETAYFRTAGDFIKELAGYQASLSEADVVRNGLHTGDLKLTEDYLSKFLGGEDDRINQHDFKMIVHMLHDKKIYLPEMQGKLLSATCDDALYHAMLEFLRVGELTLANLKRRAPGLYTAWRPSSSFPGRFWRGILEISVDPNSYAVCVSEQYYAPARDKSPARHISFDGYLFRKSQLYTMVTRNNTLSTLQMSHMPVATVFDDEIVTLGGFVTDMTTARLYTSRIFYERIPVDGEITTAVRTEERNNMAVVGTDEVPHHVQAFFDPKPIPNIHMF